MKKHTWDSLEGDETVSCAGKFMLTEGCAWLRKWWYCPLIWMVVAAYITFITIGEAIHHYGWFDEEYITKEGHHYRTGHYCRNEY